MNNFCILIRRTVYISLGLFDQLFKIKQPPVSVLCYHSINTGWHHDVSLKNFTEQIKYLSTKFNFIDIQTFVDFMDSKKTLLRPSILITFDDGYKDIVSIKSILDTYKIKPTVFLIGQPDRVNRIELDNNKELLKNEDAEYRLISDWDFGFHTQTHPDLLKIDIQNIDEEIKSSKMNYKYFAFPKGRYNQNILSKIKDMGYELCFTMNDGLINSATNKLLIPRIGINSTHNFSEFKYIMTPSNVRFRKIAKKVLEYLHI